MANASPFDLRLSHAAQWVRCAAFVRVNRTPQADVLEQAGDNTIREEGTAMHWAAQYFSTVKVGDVAPNGVVISDELYEGAAYYLGVLDDEDDVVWHIEEMLAAPSIHERCGGTPDAFGFRAASSPIVLLRDLKGGYRPVEAFPNWQLFGYIAAIIDAYPNLDTPDTVIDMGIVQPRAYHRKGPFRKHVMTLGEVYPYVDALHMAASIATGEHAKAVAGPQCDDCAGRASCAVAHAAGMRALEVSGDPDVHDLPIPALDYEMQRLEEAKRMIEARLTGLQAQAAHLIRNGAMLPNYALEAGAGRLKWIDDDAERAAIAMGDLMGYNLRKPVQAITPTQAMDKLPKELLEQYARRNKGEVKLVRFDRNAAVKAFSHLKDK